MEKLNEEELLRRVNGYAWEGQWGARTWREQSWRDSEVVDGGDGMFTPEAYLDMVDAGIEPIPINRAFPVVNTLLGSQIINRFEIAAKGRTKKDGEISEVMSEGIKFVMDQHEGEFLVSQAYRDAVIPGFGCISPCIEEDPRKERVAMKYRDWKEIWWDPFSPPWWSPSKTRYVFWQRWVDLDDLQSLFPEKSKDISDAYNEISGASSESGYSFMLDEAEMVEERVRTLASSDWIDLNRKRVRPVEMWFPVNKRCLFALFPDGRCFEIREDMNPLDAYQLISSAQQVMQAIVKKMRTITFFGEHLILQHQATPYPHDMFPFVPFIGYLDRYNQPYGVPRQIRGQCEEVSKRRSVALAMLQKRRVIAERGVVPNGNRDDLDILHDEANKIDGFMLVEDNKLDRFKIEEMANLVAPQINMMQISEAEIRDIAGTNATMLVNDGNAESGVAKQVDILRGEMTTASLKDNLRRSMRLLGEQLSCNIQGFWKYEKVLRVTDRLSGAERFVTVNQPVVGGVRNNITQGKYDIVVSETPASDTVREKNMDLLYASIEKSPAEAVPVLLTTAFEMSDLPNKERLVEKLKTILGVDVDDESLDPQQAKQQALEIMKAHKERESMLQQMEDEALRSELLEKRLKNEELAAKIAQIKAKTVNVDANTAVTLDGADLDREMAEVEALEKGVDMGVKLRSGNDNTSGGRSV